MLTKWLCRSDNSLGPGWLCSQSDWRPRPLGTVPACRTQVQATSYSAPARPSPGDEAASLGRAGLPSAAPAADAYNPPASPSLRPFHAICPKVSRRSPAPEASSTRIFSVSGEGGPFILAARASLRVTPTPLSHLIPSLPGALWAQLQDIPRTHPRLPATTPAWAAIISCLARRHSLLRGPRAPTLVPTSPLTQQQKSESEHVVPLIKPPWPHRAQ